ncbi:hypothetical protein, partial [Streptomyces sp. SBT349]|uniref:hypothetical protein n=1 Tax=Streptomyces sp. SBT349 TaxID=1580539 RepID=UPI00066CB7C0
PTADLRVAHQVGLRLSRPAELLQAPNGTLLLPSQGRTFHFAAEARPLLQRLLVGPLELDPLATDGAGTLDGHNCLTLLTAMHREGLLTLSH